MKRTASGIGLIFLAGSLYAQFPGPNPGSVRKPRPRVIATTDGEIDDRCSMVRFLLYAIEFQIEGGGPARTVKREAVQPGMEEDRLRRPAHQSGGVSSKSR